MGCKAYLSSPSPGVCSNSCPLGQWCYLTISSSNTHFSFAFHLPQHQNTFQWVSSLHQVAKVPERGIYLNIIKAIYDKPRPFQVALLVKNPSANAANSRWWTKTYFQNHLIFHKVLVYTVTTSSCILSSCELDEEVCFSIIVATIYWTLIRYCCALLYYYENNSVR